MDGRTDGRTDAVSAWREEECSATCGGGTLLKSRIVTVHASRIGMPCQSEGRRDGEGRKGGREGRQGRKGGKRCSLQRLGLQCAPGHLMEAVTVGNRDCKRRQQGL